MIFTTSVIAQEAQITFINQDIAAAKKAAKAKDQIMFVDAYTTWCGPCKMMDRNTFNDKEVATFYNDNFVNLKLDMEKGNGVSFSSTYEVRGYPSLLFLDADGQLVHRALGYHNTKDFLSLGEAAIDPDRQVMTLQRRFESGDRDKTFLANYADALTMAGMDGYEHVTKAYLETESDWKSPDNIQFLFDYSKATYDSDLFKYMLKNEADFRKVIGEDKVDQKKEFAAASDIRSQKVEVADKEAVQNHFARYFGDDATSRGTAYYLQTLMYAPGEVNEQKYLSEVMLFMATSPELSSQVLNSHAWRIYELSDDRSHLSEANEWIDKSIQLEENSYNTDTKAAILYKLGEKKEALTMAERSVELAEKEGNDSKATRDLIEKIKKM